MIQSIGELSGKVYQTLDANGEMTITKLKNTLNSDAFLLNAAIGWLAREDKLDLIKSGRSVKVALRK